MEDARVYSEHAQKKELDISDVKLAVQAKMDHSFTTPPPRDVCMQDSERVYFHGATLKIVTTLCKVEISDVHQIIFFDSLVPETSGSGRASGIT